MRWKILKELEQKKEDAWIVEIFKEMKLKKKQKKQKKLLYKFKKKRERKEWLYT